MHRTSWFAALAVVGSLLVVPNATAEPAGAGHALPQMSLEEKVGQLFVTWVHGTSADEAHPGNRRDFGVDTAAEVVSRYHVGGVVYFNNASRDNIDTPRQIAALSNGLQRAARIPLMISTDQEMGIVTRIGPPATQFPGSMALGASRSAEAAREAATITGRELRAMGITQDFAPDADVNSNPANPVIGVRSFSSDPALTAEMVAAQVQGYEGGNPLRGVSATAKHFPGHGDTATDSHTSLPVVSRTVEQWRTTDAPPFRAAIDAGVDSIMTAHIQMPNIDPSGEPATLSEPVLTGLLRDELGYDGVVITDALEMAGVRQLHSDAEIPVLALRAGADQLLMPVNLDTAIKAVIDAVRTGVLTEERIDQSVSRVLKMKAKRGLYARTLVDEEAVGTVVGTPENVDTAQRITDRTVTGIRNDAGVLPLTAGSGSVLVTGWGDSTTLAVADRIAARGARTSVVTTGAAPTQTQINAAVAAASNATTVVVLTNGLATQAAQRTLVGRLLATGKPVVAVAVRNPYDVAHTAAPTWLATYSYSPGVAESLTRALYGEITPGGRLPVDVPGPTPYPFGHGIGW